MTDRDPMGKGIEGVPEPAFVDAQAAPSRKPIFEIKNLGNRRGASYLATCACGLTVSGRPKAAVAKCLRDNCRKCRCHAIAKAVKP